MNIIEKSIILPLPNDDDLEKLEVAFRVQFPAQYKLFLKRYNSCELIENCLLATINKRCVIERFLGIVKNYKEHSFGIFDIGVCETSLGEQERNYYRDDILGTELVPIAKLAWGDYLCLNYHYDKNNPSVDFLDYEESGYCDPVTSKIADSFGDLAKMLSIDLDSTS
ncbi:SMI1/KNR4 family protein [Paenibacillus elgii]|uniref:SMI1/KNR4 family protein n=1 Tax=Paenibacillus elgii TaxID=189691 RepID=UPI00203E4A46|nr:SMI1/KNR4 family protein [Paenibacillus elgii]MCM3274203.1 SMI1/KNR4 family protein [Paenibacillus elgii]